MAVPQKVEATLMDGQLLGTLFGGLLGFLAAALPNVYARMKDVFEHQKVMDLNDQRIELARAGLASVASDEGVVAPVTEVAAIVAEGKVDAAAEDAEAEEAPNWVQSLMASLRVGVRPLITYAFFVIFVYVKIKAMQQGYFVDGTSAVELLPVIWDEGTQTLFSAVLAFWFGSRAFDKEQDAKIAGTT